MHSAKLMLATAALGVSVGATSAPAATIADFAADFSASSNPNGAWTYGYATVLGAAPSVSGTLTSYGAGNEIKAWSPTGTFWPTVALNTTGNAVSFGAGDVVTLSAHEGLLHPGAQGEFAIARFVLQAPVLARLDVSFRGVDRTPTRSDFHVLKNGTEVFGGQIDGFGSPHSFSASYQFAAGDTLDLAVGWGSNQNFTDDSTGFFMTLSPVPEPRLAALLVSGLLAVALVGRGRRSA